jgi:hypothetical protein
MPSLFSKPHANPALIGRSDPPPILPGRDESRCRDVPGETCRPQTEVLRREESDDVEVGVTLRPGGHSC